MLSELVALLGSRTRMARADILTALDEIRTDQRVTIVYADASLDAEAYRLLANRLDKQWSLVDAASFVVMERFGILDALTNDEHVEQAHMIRLLK